MADQRKMLVRVACQNCGAFSPQILIDHRKEPALEDLPPGWSETPFPADHQHRDGSTGTRYTCAACAAKRRASALIIPLTEWQSQELAHCRVELQRMADEGAPGMLFAQVFTDHMRIGLMTNDKCRKLQEVFGGVTDRTITSAHDALPVDQKQRN